MKPSMLPKLDQLVERIVETNALLACEDAAANLDQCHKPTHEHAELEPVVAQFAAWKQAEEDIVTAQELAADPDMKALTKDELRVARERMESLKSEPQRLLLPKDPNDHRNIFAEIRAGTGGDESALSASDPLWMHTRYVERQRWQVEIVSEPVSDLGGYKKVIARPVGEGAYSRLKFESGGHHAQCVPAMKTQGRIHISVCTVAIMSEVDALADIQINPTDSRIDTFRASGAGGQHINKTEPAVRITHLPTGLMVERQGDRSQYRNKDRAVQVLAARLKDRQEHEAQAKEASARKSLIGSGDRSDRTRTYNFPQGRVTDCRISLTLYKIDAIMDGDTDEFVDVLTAEHQVEQLAAPGEDS